jgi:spermidine synthase
MKYSQSTQDNDLKIPNQTLGIFLISILGLFLETLFIRWIGTEIRIFAYLQNTILVACFLGLGLGMFTSSQPIEMKRSLTPLLVLVALIAIPATRVALGHISEMLNSLGELEIWYGLIASDLRSRIVFLIIGLVLTYSMMILMVDIFIQPGRILGRLMNINPNPIWAYSVNIVGSIFGTWLFVLLSFFYQPPFVWFLIAGILLLIFVLWSNRDQKLNLALLALIVVLSWFAGRVPGALQVVWSPYQKLVVQKEQPNEGLQVGEYVITVNNIGYQGILDLSVAHVTANPATFDPKLKGLSQYDIPLLVHPSPKSVLIVGAGSGNDAAGALRNHAWSVTAVEIDPAIIRMGRQLHPEQPYTSPKVQIINDDARSFLARTTHKYDVISFGLLDSHTMTSLTNARLDHYVYTKESIAQAKSRLADGGILVLAFQAQRPFITDRIANVLEEVFNEPPVVFVLPRNSYGWGGIIYVTGDLGNFRKQLAKDTHLAAYIKSQQENHPVPLTHTTKITTDDWPYLYLESRKIPSLYYYLIGIVLILFLRSYRKWRGGEDVSFTSRTFWHFAFLGAAFMLLEVQNISKASVVLGNTWQVNAVIISGILGMSLLANWIAYKFPNVPIIPVYALLVGTALGLYFIDLARFGFLPYFMKAIIIGSLTSLPMLFSGIVFVRSFAVAQDKSNALGANLIGALGGALLQSITFVTGIKFLLLVVAGLYLLSPFTSPIQRQAKERVMQSFAK